MMMLKQFFRRLFVSGKSDLEPGAQLLASQQARAALSERIDRTRAEMEQVIQDGVGLEGSAALLNQDRYRALSSSLSSDRRRLTMLTSSITQLQSIHDIDEEYHFVEALDRDSRAYGDIEQLERRQDLIELRAEALTRHSEQLAELQARRDQVAFAGCAPDDEYTRLVAAARERASAVRTDAPAPDNPPRASADAAESAVVTL